jgi:hypothetical protein
MATESFIGKDLDVKALTDATRNKINSLCTQVYQKPVNQCTKEEVITLIEMDIRLSIGKMNVQVSGTRQVEQFNPNTYGATLEINFSESYDYMLNQVRLASTPEELIEKYVQMRSVFLTLVGMKFRNTEDYLRSLCRDAELKDNVKPVGRYA